MATHLFRRDDMSEEKGVSKATERGRRRAFTKFGILKSFLAVFLLIFLAQTAIVQGQQPQPFWRLTGNAGTNPTDNFLGTTDNQPLVIRTNSTEAMRIDTTGNASIVGNLQLGGDLSCINCIQTSDLVDGAVNGAKIFDGSIGTPDLADGAVNSAKIFDGSVATADLADGAVTLAKLAANSVDTNKIVDGSITAVDIDKNGLDADLLDGLDSTAFALTGHTHDDTYWGLTGNASTNPATNFLGTTDNQPLIIKTNADNDSTEKIYVGSNGNVGINTSIPQEKLHVGGNMLVGGNLEANSLQLAPANQQILFHDPGGYDFKIFSNSGTTLDVISPEFSGGTTALRIHNNGNVGLGTSIPQNILTVPQGSATDPIADAWTVYSSRRWKTNIEPMQDALAKVSQLRGVTFDWKTDGKHDIGLIAEEVGTVVPEVVVYEENGVDAKSVDYARLVPLLIEATKEQQLIIDNLQRQNAEMEKRLAALEALVYDQR